MFLRWILREVWYCVAMLLSIAVFLGLVISMSAIVIFLMVK